MNCGKVAEQSEQLKYQQLSPELLEGEQTVASKWLQSSEAGTDEAPLHHRALTCDAAPPPYPLAVAVTAPMQQHQLPHGHALSSKSAALPEQ
jgi:hypothetical protein